MQPEANDLIAQVEAQRNAALNQAANALAMMTLLMRENERLTKELDAARNPDPKAE